MDKELLKTTLFSIAGGVMSYHPLTSAIFTYLSTFRNEIETRFLKDFILKLDERISKREDKVDKEYIKSDDFNNFLYKTIHLAANDVRKEKLSLFANIIVNSALIGNANENDGLKSLFDETIDKIDENLFGFLLKMSSRVLHESDTEHKGWDDGEEDLEQLNINRTSFHLYADYLLSIGVVVRLPKYEFDTKTGEIVIYEKYFVTQYGKQFVEFVKEQDK